MENAPDQFAAWLSTQIRPELNERGFTKTGSNFHRRGPAGWGVINFQKSQLGSRLETRFTINLGVALDRLTIARGGDPRKKPPENQCIWRSRIAEAAGEADDRWWELKGETDLPNLTAENLSLLIDRGLPPIEQRLTDVGFVGALTTSDTVGHTAFFTDGHIIASPAPHLSSV